MKVATASLRFNYVGRDSLLHLRDNTHDT